MDILADKINQQFQNEFSYLKTIEVVYNTSAKSCNITFLYPENIKKISLDERQKILQFLNQTLKLNAKLIIKFKKSYLDKELIIKSAFNAFKNNYSSLASLISIKNFKVEVNAFNVLIKVYIFSKYLRTYNVNGIKNKLKTHLTKNFCAEFEIEFEEGTELNEAEILKNKQEDIIKKLNEIKVTPRYLVTDVVKVIGNDIEPQPEFFANINSSKNLAILAGRVENLSKKTYKRKQKGIEVEKYYYSFILNENVKKINCIYFCPKSNIRKMDKITNDNEIIIVANVKVENKVTTAYVKSLSYCKMPKKIVATQIHQPTEYKVIFPEKIVSVMQKNLFETNSEFFYNDNIKNNVFVVYDVETTGLEAETCELIEIGAVKIVNGVYTEKFQSLIKPKVRISDFITEITGITNEMVENAPSSEEVIKDFFLFSKDTILAGYNVNFDMKFIEKAANEIGLSFDNEVQDIMVLARQNIHVGNYKLKTVVNSLGINLVDAHRAYNDAFATAEVLLKLSKAL
ncbi:MAG: exonuclease domain-containing protein [Clostridia bacterium]|nr:exonuclease domain-containing protein [Clostridia bacterium]